MIATQEAIAPSPIPQPKKTPCVPPGATLGMFGSGQLGRMFIHAAQRLGYRVHVFSPHVDSPAGQVADFETIAPYEDLDAVASFSKAVDVVTLEFENVPAIAPEAAARTVPVRPAPSVLHHVQHRLREKTFLRDAGIACAPFAAVRSVDDLAQAARQIGCPAVLKTAADGYDGKGQAKVAHLTEAHTAWESIDCREAILESFVEFTHELSILATRGVDGETVTHGPIANSHADHILDVSVMPHPDVTAFADEAAEIARTIVERLEVIGIVCVEFFLTTNGQLLVNEIAPRPHNSGHLTIDACVTSQFEQQVRAICGLPLGSAEQHSPAAMANLLGDLWADGEPAWSRALDFPEVKLHLYGKREARPGRKMGHLTALAATPAEAERIVRAARAALMAG